MNMPHLSYYLEYSLKTLHITTCLDRVRGVTHEVFVTVIIIVTMLRDVESYSLVYTHSTIGLTYVEL